MANYEINTDKILETISENPKIPDKDEELIREFVRQSHLKSPSTKSWAFEPVLPHSKRGYIRYRISLSDILSESNRV